MTFAASCASLAVSLCMAILVSTAMAGPRDDAMTAYARGDYPTALRLLQPLAYGGDADAQFYLGLLYANGEGVPQNYLEAVKWFRSAADRGVSAAQFNLGILYARGQGVRQDYAEAIKWYRRAADQGDPKAQFNLGSMYDDGRGVSKDYAVAATWYGMAADQGDPKAQFNLGFMYDNGQGVPQDYVQAYKWFTLAASRFPTAETENRDKATKNRDRVAAKMTPAHDHRGAETRAQVEAEIMQSRGSRRRPQQPIQRRRWPLSRRGLSFVASIPARRRKVRLLPGSQNKLATACGDRRHERQAPPERGQRRR